MKESTHERRVTRRTAINSGLAVAAGSVAVLSNPSAVLGLSKPHSAEIAAWAACLNQVFDVDCTRHDGQELVGRLKLVEVKPLETDPQNRPSQARGQAVSLLFESDHKNPLPSTTYRFTNASAPTMELMICQTRDEQLRSSLVYEAVLN